MYVCGNTEERSSNYSCVKKGLKGTFSQCVSADFIIQHEENNATHYVYNVVSLCVAKQKFPHYLIICTGCKRIPDREICFLSRSAELSKKFLF
jgi:hypothetical protein